MHHAHSTQCNYVLCNNVMYFFIEVTVVGFPLVENFLSPSKELLVTTKVCLPLLYSQSYCAMLGHGSQQSYLGWIADCSPPLEASMISSGAFKAGPQGQEFQTRSNSGDSRAFVQTTWCLQQYGLTFHIWGITESTCRPSEKTTNNPLSFKYHPKYENTNIIILFISAKIYILNFCRHVKYIFFNSLDSYLLFL